MARVLIFKHVAAEPLGTLYPLLRARGHRLRFANFFREPNVRPTLERYDALVVLGGPMNVDQTEKHPHLSYELQAIDYFLKEGRPILGICLGAQLLAHALGAKVFKNPTSEIGWYPLEPTSAAGSDAVLEAIKAPATVFQWHGCTFDLPDGAQHLASSPHCRNQAFSYGQTAWGLQFHLEVDRDLIKRWVTTTSYVDELRASGVTSTPEDILGDTERHLPASEALATEVFSKWLNLLPTKRTRAILPSR